jgi:hypothetical protein
LVEQPHVTAPRAAICILSPNASAEPPLSQALDVPLHVLFACAQQAQRGASNCHGMSHLLWRQRRLALRCCFVYSILYVTFTTECNMASACVGLC